MIKSMVFAVLLAVVFMSGAFAQGDDAAAEYIKKLLKTYDRNFDGKITKAEWDDVRGKPYPDEVFKKADKNGDDTVTKEELLAEYKVEHPAKPKPDKQPPDKKDEPERPVSEEEAFRNDVHAAFVQADLNKNKTIALEEWMKMRGGGVQKNFDMADQNVDSQVTEDELFQFLRAATQKAKGNMEEWLALEKKYNDNAVKRKMSVGDQTPKKDKKLEEKVKKRVEFELKESDSNYDKRLSKDEWLWSEELFEEYDKDNNGSLFSDELTAYFEDLLNKKFKSDKKKK